ncbi:MAG: NAD(P)-dependent oxidoreductase [Rhodospirillaceae bacterium]|jgi:dihydropyrimidine dehydrogenase (NAD+) subunit PreT|nr:NAD(P)-dependent oxidoreductase [Rhodospirillaceae bacterium]MBT5243614.1 NAD(P)-dependent oxidoreductase [Rhodospirillaceae bacterium]MBT5562202.1 NAD(P)-dependent oxidoreductase [Rhodospirillaceae bacterium]MBT6242375.1 NAD(P)-dependent oxidoreductase [Rhodospirillaceae bacterium]MBT7138919.1 NAD(P)-dependent oxidoreductase [Rhodospirillaceae bacterium]
MANASAATGISTGRLQAQEYDSNFNDLHDPLNNHQASIEASRCYFCFDAPCMTACPTSIDIPLFIRQITTGNTGGAARTIFNQNIMGGMCARVCPTETLCEEACVRATAEDKPVKIGHLQRYATDAYMETGDHPFKRAAQTGKKIAVVGGGPAGMSCAHRLASLGHAVTVFEGRGKTGGLNEFGIASYKSTNNFAAREIQFILSIGGIEVKTGSMLGSGLDLNDLRDEFDAVFLGLGLGGSNDLRLDGEDLDGVINAIDYIADLRQAIDLGKLPVGRNIVVIGGGMTAVDIAVQTKLLGAQDVTIVYRRGQEQMKASRYEQELAQTRGVKIIHWAKPSELVADGDSVKAISFEGTELDGQGKLNGTGETFELAADMVFKAIGQMFLSDAFTGNDGPKLENGRISVDETRKTSLPDVWAGGDCIDGGDDLTVAAVEDGKVAAMSIDKYLGEK